jgi:methyl-accepting chemotaxis protein
MQWAISEKSFRETEECRVRKSLVAKIALLVVAGVTVLSGSLIFLAARGLQDMGTSLARSAEVLLDKENENKRASNEHSLTAYGETLAQYLAWISANPLWNFTLDILEEYTKGMEQLPNLAYAVVYDDKGNVAAGAAKSGQGIRSFSKEIVQNGKVLGKAEIGMDVSYLETLHRENVATKEALVKTFVGGAEEARKALFWKILLVALAGTGGVIAVVMAVLLRMVAPLRRMTGIVEDLGQGEGDLTVRLLLRSEDEVGRLAASLDLFLDKLSELVRRIVEIAEEVGGDSGRLDELARKSLAAVEKVTEAVEQIYVLSESNAAAVEETSAGVQEVAANANAAARSAEQGAASSAKATSFTQDVAERMKDVVIALDRVETSSTENRAKIGTLSKGVDTITGLVGAITQIADQTNLLALNAAIEAARAGEAGRGFAVVAEEVRKLAEESNRAAQEIRGIIAPLRASAEEAISAASETERILGGVSSSARDVQEKLTASLGEIAGVNEVMQNIAAVAAMQSAASGEMAKAIDGIAKSTSQTVEHLGGIRESAGATAEAFEAVVEGAGTLSESVAGLRELLGQFKIAKEQPGGKQELRALPPASRRG